MATWINTSTASASPVQREFIREMAGIGADLREKAGFNFRHFDLRGFEFGAEPINTSLGFNPDSGPA